MHIDFYPDAETRIRFYPEGGVNVSTRVPGIGWVLADDSETHPELTPELLAELATHAVAIFRVLNPA